MEGAQLFIPDTLSRAVGKNSPHNMSDLQINMVSIIPMLERMKAATEKDEYLQTSRQYTQMGWPSDKHPLTRVLCLISRKKDISEEDGILYKGEQAIIPVFLRSEIKEKLHATHLGYESMIRRTRTVVFWPGIQHEMKQMADCCETYQRHEPCNQRETLRPPNFGNFSCADLCELYSQRL